MDIYKIVLIGIISTVIIVLIRDVKGELAVIIGLASSIIILLMVMNMLGDVVVTFNTIVTKTGISSSLFTAVLKVIGVGYIAEFAANIAEDANNKSVANKILFGGKVIIMLLALPIVEALVDIIIAIL